MPATPSQSVWRLHNWHPVGLLYSIQYQLPDAWQIGMNPTISYNDKAESGNRLKGDLSVKRGLPGERYKIKLNNAI
jgi:hypothetical protein